MDSFQEAAANSDLNTVFTTGAVYGIFLVFGNSWSEFLKIAIISISPKHDNEVFAALIYALSATFITILSLFSIVRLHKCMQKHVSTTNIMSQTKKLKIYLAKRSRTDIANAK